MLESGIIYNGYELSAGRKWIYNKTYMKGKRDYKLALTAEGREELKRIAEETEWRTLERHRAMKNVWDNMAGELIQ